MRYYARRLICIIFQIKENMLAVVTGKMGGCQCGRIEKKISLILQYIFKFCLVPLHKREFFQRCQSLKH
jgi:hypothetical protein